MYDHYDTFKGWDNYFHASNEDRRYFSREFRDFSLAGKRILEIGYGSGALLAWFAEQGAEVAGVEITQRSLEEARQRGLNVYTDIASAQTAERPFDLIVAFDVLEHLSIDAILALLQDVKKALSANGSMLIRVPNGRSPWGLANQYGDLTHITVLSDLRLNQLALETGFRLSFCRDQALVKRSSAKGWFLDLLFHSARRILNLLIGRIFGLGNMPMEANIIALLAPSNDKRSG